MRRKRFIQLCVRSTTQRRARNPASCFNALASSPRRLHVGREAELPDQIPDIVIVIALVQAHPLRLLGCRIGPLHRDALQRRLDQLLVVTIGPVDGQAHRHPGSLRHQAPLGAQLAPIRGILPGPLAPQRGLGHRTVHRQPPPIEPLQLVVFLQALRPRG